MMTLLRRQIFDEMQQESTGLCFKEKCMKKSLGAKTLIYPAPVFLIGTYDKDGKPNAMAASWSGICCSKPPCLYVSVRKTRLTYKNIKNRKAFTVNIPSAGQMAEADYFGTVSGRKADKFAVTGWTAAKSGLVDAPYIRECSLVLECALLHTLEIGVHTQFVGEIKDVKAEEDILDQDKIPLIEKLKPMIYTPEYGWYYAVGKRLDKAYSAGKKYTKT